MDRIQQYIPEDLAFAWMGALCGFIAFQHSIGNTLAKKIYLSFSEGHGIGAVSNHEIAGLAYSLNYGVQFLVSVLGGGYALGTTEMRSSVPTHGNAAITATMAFIYLWSFIFGDSHWLSRMFSFMIKWVSRASRP